MRRIYYYSDKTNNLLLHLYLLQKKKKKKDSSDGIAMNLTVMATEFSNYSTTCYIPIEDLSITTTRTKLGIVPTTQTTIINPKYPTNSITIKIHIKIHHINLVNHRFKNNKNCILLARIPKQADKKQPTQKKKTFHLIQPYFFVA